MGMSLHVVGFRPADAKWHAMARIYKDCVENGIQVPSEVDKFFGFENPEGKPGMTVELGDAKTEWRDEDSTGYEVCLERLPEDIKVIRFFASW